MPGKVAVAGKTAVGFHQIHAVSLPTQRFLWHAKLLFGGALVLVCISRLCNGFTADNNSIDIDGIGSVPTDHRTLQAWPSSLIAEERPLEGKLGNVRGGRLLGGDGNATSSGHSAPANYLEGTVCFILVCFVIACALDHWNKLLPESIQFPISVLLFIVGMLIGILFQFGFDQDGSHWRGRGFDTFIEGMQGASHLDPHAIFYILLPPLLYESASSMSWRVLRKVLASSTILALPGVLMNTILTACFTRVFFRIDDAEFSWEVSLLLASILSATDPVAVVAALSALGAPKKLATLIEGESLLNDGSAVVFFFVFLDMVAKKAPDSTKQCAGETPSGGCVVLYFFKLAIGGPALGIAMGGVVFTWIRWAQHLSGTSPVLEIGIVISAVYGTFFLAEFCLHVSGVLAVVAFGMLMTVGAHSRMSHHGKHAHHVIFAQVGYACNQVIFFAAGMISARFMWTDPSHRDPAYTSGRTWLELAALYACIHVTRTMVVLVFAPVLTRMGYGITWKEGAILVWGGLRGAVGLAMGLMVEHNAYVDEQVSEKIAFHVSGIVLLTLLINGTTVDTVYNRLEVYRSNPFQMNYVRKVLVCLEKECIKVSVRRLKGDWFFSDVDFARVLQLCPRFSRVKFLPGGIPCPDDMVPIDETMRKLSAPKKRVLFQSFEEVWLYEKQEAQIELWTLLRKLVEIPVDRADNMKNVFNTGDERINFPSISDRAPGFYVSARPLSALRHACEQSAEHGVTDMFSVKIVKTDAVAIVVGLVTNPNAAVPSPDGDDTLNTLGYIDNTVGLNCSNCRLAYKGMEDVEEVYTGRPQVGDGETILIEVARQVGSEWKISYYVDHERGSEPALLCECVLGPFSPHDLYPAVHFLPWTMEARPTGSLDRRHTLSRFQNSVRASYISLPALNIDPQNFKAVAKVSLSYELQNASLDDTLTQIFHALFNFVSHQYEEMHEQGIIGNSALTQLQEAVGEAQDCADHELHHKHALDYDIHDKVNSILPPASPSSRDLRHICCDMKLSRENSMGISNKSYMVMFEPAIVQYLALEKYCSAATMEEASWCPIIRKLLRKFGYGSVQTKVEVLWAFITVHKKMLKECSALERHPQLIECFQGIVDAARSDLAVLQSLKPRRFFYSKHFLAVRMMVAIRAEKLKHFVKEGWISEECSEKWREELRQRMHNIRSYVPPTEKQQERQRGSGGGLGIVPTLSIDNSNTAAMFLASSTSSTYNQERHGHGHASRHSARHSVRSSISWRSSIRSFVVSGSDDSHTHHHQQGGPSNRHQGGMFFTGKSNDLGIEPTGDRTRQPSKTSVSEQMFLSSVSEPSTPETQGAVSFVPGALGGIASINSAWEEETPRENPNVDRVVSVTYESEEQGDNMAESFSSAKARPKPPALM